MCAQTFELIFSGMTAVFTGLLFVGTCILARVTYLLFIETRDAAKRQLGVNTWLHFINKWDSAEMAEHKRNAALQCMTGVGAAEIDDGVLDFFEQVGVAFQADCLDKKLTNSSFSYDAIRWWAALEWCVTEMREQKKDPSFYEDFEQMVKILRASNSAESAMDDQAIRGFLKDVIGT